MGGFPDKEFGNLPVICRQYESLIRTVCANFVAGKTRDI
jgi:hypothetical protein